MNAQYDSFVNGDLDAKAQFIIQHCGDKAEQFHLEDCGDHYRIQGDTAQQLLAFTYTDAPDLNTAVASFAVMCRVFNEYSSVPDSVCQEWFEYNIVRWARSYKITGKQLKKWSKNAFKNSKQYH